MLVLCMVEHEIFHRQFFSQFAGFFYGAVVFLIGLEDIPVLVLAERFGEQPVGLFRILSGMFVVGFIPQAGELQPISKFEFITELLGLGGHDIKGSQLKLRQFDAFPVFDFLQDNIRAHAGKVFFLEGHGRHFFEHILDHIMAIDMELAVKLTFVHKVGHFTDNPDHTEYMVSMTVGYEHMMAFIVVEVRDFELAQDAIAAAGISQEQTAVLQFQKETGVKAFRGHGKASA